MGGSGNKWRKVLYGIIFVYTIGCFAAWFKWSRSSTSDENLMTYLPISALILIILALWENHHLILRQETIKWLSQKKELEMDAKKSSEELKLKNTQLQNVLEDINHLGYYDALTDLPNRRLFMRQLANALNRARRNNHLVAVLYVDLDNFKIINDTMGHSLGDLVLKELGVKIKNSIRDIDIVSRQGGDEYTLLLDEIANFEEAQHLTAALHRSIQESFLINDVEVHVEASIGVALYPWHGDSIDNLIKYADIAMYSAKNQGKNQFVFYTAEMNQVFVRRMSLDKELRSAIQNEEFSLYYQPQIDIVSGEIIGIEALIRWNNLILGAVPPSELIPIAEENGQIIPLGEWVLITACQQMRTWLDEGYMIPKMAVNLSPVQFSDDKLVENVSRILRQTRLEPKYLELEITEGVAIYNEKVVLNKLTALKNIGIKIALDDFGTGYSCLAYLSQYPVDTIKIDRSFIEDILVNHDNQILVETIIIMAHNFEVRAIAEGVDTVEQFQMLRDYKCDEIQGYLIAPPISAEQLVNLIELYAKPAYYQRKVSVN